MAQLQKPNRGATGDPDSLLGLLANFYDNIRSLLGMRTPDTVPALKAITVQDHRSLRNQVGDYAGQLGPRACIVAGRTGPLDGGEGVYVWDATSTLADDDAATIQPLSLGGKPGRWRKGSF
jgi:hypothetical protein